MWRNRNGASTATFHDKKLFSIRPKHEKFGQKSTRSFRFIAGHQSLPANLRVAYFLYGREQRWKLNIYFQCTKGESNFPNFNARKREIYEVTVKIRISR